MIQYNYKMLICRGGYLEAAGPAACINPAYSSGYLYLSNVILALTW
jgi:hypothetical protein